MCGVMSFTLGEGPTSVCNYPIFPILFLVQGSTQPHGAGISMQLKGFSKVSECQDWVGGAQNPQCVKGFQAFLHPLKVLFLMSCIVTGNLIIEVASNFGITLKEASTVACEPQEALQFCNHDGNRPVLDSFDFMTISSDTVLGNLVPPNKIHWL